MRTKIVAIFISAISSILFCSPAISFENFANSWSPYPSGCVTLSGVQGLLYPGGSETIASGLIALTSNYADRDSVEADVTVTRTGCAEADRSVISITFTIRDDNDGQLEGATLPRIFAQKDGKDYPFRMVIDPSSWLEYNAYSPLFEGASATFILDVPQPITNGFDPDFFITPSIYNDSFTLMLQDILGTEYPVDILAYNNELRPSFIPLNGRLSGIWVVDGASDQGFVISFSEFPGDVASGLIFFSWYTFDEDGKNMWLVGNAVYENGDVTTSFALELVTDGDFLGGKVATRIPAGTVRISARECNLLELDYDLRNVGLGQSTVPVTRLFGLESAGYACMDVEDRLN